MLTPRFLLWSRGAVLCCGQALLAKPRSRSKNCPYSIQLPPSKNRSAFSVPTFRAIHVPTCKMARAAEGTLEHVTDFLDATHPHADARPTHKDTGSLSRTMLLILNHTLPKYTPKLLDSVEVRICGDGGANRLYDMAPYIMSDVDKDVARRWYKPDVLIGDLDSVRKEVQGFYRDAGTLLEDKSGDVDTNDMHKCMTYIDKNLVKGDSNVTVLVVGALGGRLDHEMGNLHVLFQFPHLRVVLLDDLNLVTLLMPASAGFAPCFLLTNRVRSCVTADGRILEPAVTHDRRNLVAAVTHDRGISVTAVAGRLRSQVWSCDRSHVWQQVVGPSAGQWSVRLPPHPAQPARGGPHLWPGPARLRVRGADHHRPAMEP
eukprot:jgi/Mesvir1/27661/Mv07384-RA.1